jgi:hypothetical protein
MEEDIQRDKQRYNENNDRRLRREDRKIARMRETHTLYLCEASSTSDRFTDESHGRER